jgi:hypothetical protein
LHPNRGGAQRIGVQFAPDHATTPFAGDQPRIAENAKMFGNCGQGRLKVRGDICHRHIVDQQKRQDRAPRRVGKGREYGIQGLAHGSVILRLGAMVNQMVEYGQGRLALTLPPNPLRHLKNIYDYQYIIGIFCGNALA